MVNLVRCQSTFIGQSKFKPVKSADTIEPRCRRCTDRDHTYDDSNDNAFKLWVYDGVMLGLKLHLDNTCSFVLCHGFMLGLKLATSWYQLAML